MAPSLREEFGVDGENEHRWDFNFDPNWWRDSKVDRIAAKKRIIELIAKERTT